MNNITEQDVMFLVSCAKELVFTFTKDMENYPEGSEVYNLLVTNIELIDKMTHKVETQLQGG